MSLLSEDYNSISNYSFEAIIARIVPLCRNPSFGLVTKAKGLQSCGPKGRKPGSQGKGIARVWAKKKPGSHITYSRECKKV
jgi:hypothetical protein